MGTAVLMRQYLDKGFANETIQAKGEVCVSFHIPVFRAFHHIRIIPAGFDSIHVILQVGYPWFPCIPRNR